MTKLWALRAFSLLVFGTVLVIVSPRTNAQDVLSLNPIEPIRQIEVETAAAVAWNPDGTILAVGDNTGVLFYTPELEFIRRLEQPSEQMMAMAWSPDGRYIAAVGRNGGILYNSPIYIWNVETGEQVTVFTQHTSLVPALVWSPDSTEIASGDWHSALYIWNPLTGDILQTLLPLSGYDGDVMSLSWSQTNGLLAADILQYGIVIWNPVSGTIVATTPKEPFPPIPLVVKWSPDGERLATEYGLLNGESGAEFRRFENCPPSVIIDWHPDSELLATYTRTGVFICDTVSDEILAVLSGGITETETIWGYLYSLDWHPDGDLLAGAAGDGFVRIWSVSEAVDAKKSSERELSAKKADNAESASISQNNATASQILGQIQDWWES